MIREASCLKMTYYPNRLLSNLLDRCSLVPYLFDMAGDQSHDLAHEILGFLFANVTTSKRLPDLFGLCHHIKLGILRLTLELQRLLLLVRSCISFVSFSTHRSVAPLDRHSIATRFTTLALFVGIIAVCLTCCLAFQACHGYKEGAEREN